MRSCRLRAAFAQQPHAGAAKSTAPAALLGLACHDALDSLVRSRGLFADDWRAAAEAAWQAAISRVAADLALDGPPDELPGYQIKRVRLRQVAARIRELAGDPGDGRVSLLTEETLESKDGLLFGRADLVIRGERHLLIDYKSGAITDRDTGAVKDAYVKQLQLYGFLEWQASGTWPESAHLLPFSGSPVSIPIEPAVCEALAEEARQLIAEFNAAVPGVQPATPSPQACGYCPFPVQCRPFWLACGPEWRPSIIAGAGTVVDTFTTTGGEVTLRLTPDRGNTGAGVTVLWNVSPREHPGVSSAAPGSRVAAVSLVADEERGVFKLPPWGLLRVEHASESLQAAGLTPDSSVA